MKRYILMILLLIVPISGFCGDNPDDFEFSEPNTWPSRIAPLLFLNTYEKIEELGIDFPPTYFQLEIQANNVALISFCFSYSGGASWYTREFSFISENESYEFLVANIGGSKQFVRFEFDDSSEKILMSIKQSGIWRNTDWIYFSELCFVSENYVP